MAYMGTDDGGKSADSLSIKTRCRLCSELFEEPLLVENGRAYLAGRTGIHPSEDGSPWCASCRAKIDATTRSLLAQLATPFVTGLALGQPSIRTETSERPQAAPQVKKA